MKKCEHAALWPEAALWAKLDPKNHSDKAIVPVVGFRAGYKLYQYQLLAVYITLSKTFSNRNGMILADEPGLGKVRFHLSATVTCPD